MKKIGLDIRIFGTKHGGIGRYCRELFPRILAMDKQNQYFLFYNKSSISPQELNVFKDFNHAVLVETNSRHYSFSEQTAFLHTLNKHNLDFVHFPNFNVPFFYNKPYAVTIHDMVHHKIGGAKKTHFLHFLAYKKIIKNAAVKAKAIITVSESSKRDIANFLRVADEKITVIYEGPSLGLSLNTIKSEEVINNFLLNKPYFLFVGVLERKKNLINLTRGFDKFLQKYKLNIDLVVVGKIDHHYPEIKHKAMDIKNSNHLIFTGAVEDYELSALYKGAYAFASASLHEGFGLPGVEALSFGLPLLVSNIEVFNEIYDNAAIYFNPLDPEDIAEKMYLLVRDNQFYEQQQQKSFARSRFFDWEKTARQTLGVYNQFLEYNS